MTAQFLSMDEGMRALRKLRRNELTIIEAMPALFDDKRGQSLGPFPLVVAQPRADVTDLLRIMHLERGESEVSYVWHRAMNTDLTETSWIVLQIEFSAPARCVFALAFELGKHHEFLHLLANSESFLIITEPTQRPEDALAIIGVPIRRLAETLLAYDLAKSIVADLRRKKAA